MLREMGSKKNQIGAALTRLIGGFASVVAAAMENSVEQLRGLAASRVWEEKRERIGDRGHFIGADTGRKRQVN
jgi:hypothetical protein